MNNFERQVNGPKICYRVKRLYGESIIETHDNRANLSFNIKHKYLPGINTYPQQLYHTLFNAITDIYDFTGYDKKPIVYTSHCVTDDVIFFTSLYLVKSGPGKHIYCGYMIVI